MNDLEKLREQIDEVDREMIKLLSQRQEIVAKIAQVKTRSNLPVLDEKRKQELITNRIAYGVTLGLSPLIIKLLYDLIHDHSLTFQKRLARFK